VITNTLRVMSVVFVPIAAFAPVVSDAITPLRSTAEGFDLYRLSISIGSRPIFSQSVRISFSVESIGKLHGPSYLSDSTQAILGQTIVISCIWEAIRRKLQLATKVEHPRHNCYSGFSRFPFLRPKSNESDGRTTRTYQSRYHANINEMSTGFLLCWAQALAKTTLRSAFRLLVAYSTYLTTYSASLHRPHFDSLI
jgi:hypothetical protein